MTPFTTELQSLASRFRAALGRAASREADALAAACEVGKLSLEVKEALKKDKNNLQNYSQWFAQHLKGYSLRTVHRYERVYKQVSLDS